MYTLLHLRQPACICAFLERNPCIYHNIMKNENLTTAISEKKIESHSDLLHHSQPIKELPLIFNHNHQVILIFINQLILKFSLIIQSDLLHTLSLNLDQHEDTIDK